RLRRLELAEAALQVVEHQPDCGLRRGRRSDQTLPVADDEDASGLERDLELRKLTAVGVVAPLLGLQQQRLGLLRDLLRTLLVGRDTPRVVYRPLAKFFRDRGPHLAAMIAYFALLSFVPLTFLALSLLGLAGRADESSYLVTELKKVFPGTSVSAIVKAVRSVQDNAATLGVIGGIALLWTS